MGCRIVSPTAKVNCAVEMVGDVAQVFVTSISFLSMPLSKCGPLWILQRHGQRGSTKCGDISYVAIQSLISRAGNCRRGSGS